mmetsp:Transcript_9780/g.24372  ORF Transcript_9780/g.24372 Transcript_9780/m.24372 type:complete len:946 (-) Transcript_9780:267-3104(-)|eukprot:CAMPEP_0202869366 /NCGR_PEP_ID=MMETSP1391-20130828/12413_1 /ASSEMBLY_ACC=CAM_ASM_000867 /TAXON_ID=1034604 /ORGANISM="Chlamydomonas leiostraca, Strain SAG 11-49" /LENGTH=945 /DNA_ID=CAMNT_0049549679 /DNA_START=249 /DNA_END=3086 /DNA_ORIENTATION=+
MASTLNPNAASFVPGQTPVVVQPLAAHKEPDEQFPLQDLPDEVVSSILACAAAAGGARDVLAAGAASKYMQSQACLCPVNLDLSTSVAEGPAITEQHIQAMVRTLEKRLKGVRSLDMRHLPLEDVDVLHLATSPSLPRLTQLDVSGCRKLTPLLTCAIGCVADAARAAAAAQPHQAPSAGSSSSGNGDVPGPRLRAISLQRCFQLCSDTLTQLLRAASGAGLPLAALSLSHLELGQWPLGLDEAARLGAALDSGEAEAAGMGGAAGIADSAAAAPHSWWVSGSSLSSSPGPGTPTTGTSPGMPGLHRMPLVPVLGAWFEEAGAGARACVARTARLGSGRGRSGGTAAAGGAGALSTSSSSDDLDQEAGAAGGSSDNDDDIDLSDGESEGGPAAYVCAPVVDAGVIAAQYVSGQLPLARAAPRVGLPATHLRVLALNNCNRITGLGLITLALSCPNLSVLLLGGSTLACTVRRMSAAAHSAAPDMGQGADAGSEFDMPTAVVRAQRTAAVRVAACWSTGGRRDPGCPDAAIELVTTALCLPQLRALDLTFFPASVVACVRACLDPAHFGGSARSTASKAASSGSTASARQATIQVWDLAQPGGTTGAYEALKAVRAAASRSSSDTAASAAGSSSSMRPHSEAGAWPDEGCLALGLKAAANASSASRSSPLHFAAERGDTEAVAALVALGALQDARERGGCTPLFLAAEAGHAGAVAALVRAGADARLSNSAGESPLYISALRGHLGAVRALLQHFAAHQLGWVEPWRYGDAWTPLMAAAVANRHDVALALLLAAGPTGARPLVSAVNRYGQSVLHIAARKGSVQLLRLLLEHAAEGAVRAADTSGDTPVDVAKKHGHMLAVSEFARVWPGAAHGLGAYATAVHGAHAGAQQHSAQRAGAHGTPGQENGDGQQGDGEGCKAEGRPSCPRIKTGRAHVLNRILANRML